MFAGVGRNPIGRVGIETWACAGRVGARTSGFESLAPARLSLTREESAIAKSGRGQCPPSSGRGDPPARNDVGLERLFSGGAGQKGAFEWFAEVWGDRPEIRRGDYSELWPGTGAQDSGFDKQWGFPARSLAAEPTLGVFSRSFSAASPARDRPRRKDPIWKHQCSPKSEP